MNVNEERSATGLAGKYLTFALGAEEYGLPVLKVREIIKMMDVTAVPQVPAYVRGVINLRGKVIPVIDLRLKFQMSALAASDQTCIVVVQIDKPGQRLQLGVIVDHVSEVLNVTVDELEHPPDFGDRFDTRFLLALAKVKGRVKLLLDLDAVLASESVLSRVA